MILKIFKNRGTTLVEIMVYFAIVGIVTFAAMSFSLQIIGLNSLSNNYHELQSNQDFILNKISSSIQSAASIDQVSSLFDNDQGALSLLMNDAQVSPTKFYISNGNIFLEEGVQNAIQLNSSLVKFDSFNFHRVVYSKAPDQIILDAQISPTNAEMANTNKVLNLHLTSTLRNL